MFIALWHIPQSIIRFLPFLAEYNTSPKFTAMYVITLLMPWWGLKVVMALADTPFVYILTAWLRGDGKEPKKLAAKC
jgi:uncharacterized PurR-regulated membrane protein YhhQ (DUF165 family)